MVAGEETEGDARGVGVGVEGFKVFLTLKRVSISMYLLSIIDLGGGRKVRWLLK